MDGSKTDWAEQTREEFAKSPAVERQLSYLLCVEADGKLAAPFRSFKLSGQ